MKTEKNSRNLSNIFAVRIHERVCLFAAICRKKNVKITAFILLVALQIGLIGYWAANRSNYYIDEMFSFGSAHSYTFEKKDIMYINASDSWKYEEWVDNSELKEQMYVSDSESLLRKDPKTAISMLLFRRNYHGILNMLMTLFSSGRMSMGPPIVFNLVLFVFSQILLLRIVMELTDSYPVAFLAATMYGFSEMAISTHLYIRFYALVVFLLLSVIRLHQLIWREKKLYKAEGLVIAAMILIYLAFKNSELVLIFGGILVFAFVISLFLNYQYKKGLIYVVTVIPPALFFCLRKTNLIKIILHPGSYMNGNGAEGWITRNLLTVNKDRVISLIFKYLAWFSDLLFGSWYVLCCFAVLFIILLEFRFLGKTKTGNSEARVKRIPFQNGKGMTGVLTCVALAYYVFALLTALPAQRYFMFYYPLVAILFWKLIDVLTKGIKYRGEILVGCSLLVCIGIIAAQVLRPDRIDFVYMNDRPAIQSVRESGIEDAIAIYTDERDSNHSCYDCINLMPENSRIYPIKIKSHHFIVQGCPEKMLVWIHKYESPDEYLEDLINENYEIEKIGSTHASDIYVVQRE